MRQLLPPADITEIARLQHLASRYRLPIAMVLAAFSITSLGATKAGLWAVAVLVCETGALFCTRPAMRRLLTKREMILYALSGVVNIPAWAMLGVMFWYTPAPQDCAVAVALWVGQLLYTQRFIFQSYLAIVMGNSVMVVTMILVPLLHPLMSGPGQLLFEIGLLFCIGFTISASLAAYARIRSLAEQNAAIERAAITDELTGLPNRGRFTRSLDAAIAARLPVCVLYMDLDRFKLVNDTLGHQAGDALLRQFAGRLLEVSPPGALVARLGGDEFATLITADGFKLQDVEALCQRIVSTVSAPFAIDSGQAHVGVSIGVAMLALGEASSVDVMRRADIALYTVKANGRAGFRIFSEELEIAIRDRAEIEEALRVALVSFKGLSLAYQPKVDCAGNVMGVEALLRWHLDNKAISPAVFVPIAEETGLIVPLGNWVIQEAMAFAKRWPDLSVAVNLSPAQLRDPTFTARLLALSARTQIPPSQLELEITETTLFDAAGEALSSLDALRAAGLRVALDDFGTGYSSLRHLHSVSVDRVKIDQSFVAGLGRGGESAAIIAAVIQLSHSMGISVTAEGVETSDQRDFLIASGADELQGYFYSKPLAEGDLAIWMEKQVTRLAA